MGARPQPRGSNTAPSKAKGGRYQNRGLKGNRRICLALPPCALLFVAVHAKPVDLEGMASRPIIEFAANFLLQTIDFRRKELDRTAASGTNHVVVTAAVVLMLKSRFAIVELYLTGQTAFGEELQCPIDSGHPNPSIASLNQAVQLVSGKMVASLQKRLQDGIALVRLLESYPLQMLTEDILSLAQHLGGDHGMVVDTFVRHT